MFRIYACNSHTYTHLIVALGIVRKPTGVFFLFSFFRYPGTHDIGCLTTGEARHGSAQHIRMHLEGVFIHGQPPRYANKPTHKQTAGRQARVMYARIFEVINPIL